MKYLYHGTNNHLFSSILQKGILPRINTKEENRWGEFPSREDCVYLSRLYAPYFALTKIDVDQEEKGLLVRIKKDDLDQDKLLPDEDYIGQAFAGTESLEVKTKIARKSLHLLGEFAEKSIQMLGNCAYMGKIPPHQIDKIVEFDLSHFMVGMALDPTISIMNCAILGGKYTALTEWFFEEPTEEGFLQAFMFNGFDNFNCHGIPEVQNRLKEHRERALKHWFNKEGITVLYDRKTDSELANLPYLEHYELMEWVRVRGGKMERDKSCFNSVGGEGFYNLELNNNYYRYKKSSGNMNLWKCKRVDSLITEEVGRYALVVTSRLTEY